MKFVSSVVMLAVFGMAATSIQAAPELTGCAAKRVAIETELANANMFSKPGLQKALKEHNEHCTDDGLRAKREAEVADSKAKVVKREAKLAEAKAKGDNDKIAERQQELLEAQNKLKQAELELQR